jgi:hypothetical protein
MALSLLGLAPAAVAAPVPANKFRLCQASMSAEALRAVTSGTVRAMKPWQIRALSKKQARQLRPEQIRHLGPVKRRILVDKRR